MPPPPPPPPPLLPLLPPPLPPPLLLLLLLPLPPPLLFAPMRLTSMAGSPDKSVPSPHTGDAPNLGLRENADVVELEPLFVLLGLFAAAAAVASTVRLLSLEPAPKSRSAVASFTPVSSRKLLLGLHSSAAEKWKAAAA